MSVFSPVVGVLLKTVTAYYYSLHVRTVYTSSLRVLYVYMCMHVRDEEGSVYISLHHESLVNSAVMHNLSDRFAKLTPHHPPSVYSLHTGHLGREQLICLPRRLRLDCQKRTIVLILQ